MSVRSVSQAAPQMLAIDDPQWQSFVAHTEGATPFHHPEWSELLARTYRYRAFAIALTDTDGAVTAGAPFLEVRSLSRRRRWVSLPFTDECPPLAKDAASLRELSASLGAVHELYRAPTLELRAAVDGFGWQTSADAVIHELQLDREAARVQERFSRAMVRNIRRAEKEGVTVRRATEPRDLDAFYRLHTRTRRRQGVPVQPRRFFELFWSGLIQTGLASILLADAGGAEPVAAALFLSIGGTTIYKFGASDVEFQRLRPNHLIFWTAIQQACERGDRLFDFGRTDLGNEGLRAFKSGWGASERPLKYSSLAPGAGADGFATRALSGAIRKGPSWICRGTGEALYRYAASR